jgi:tRNA-specific 2-thiouridylase
LHVLKIDTEQNALIVGPAKELEKSICIASKMHYINGDTPAGPFKALARIRYKAPEQEAVVTPLEGKRAHVTFAHSQRAITPGQAIVFYGGEDGDDVLCGGIIE